MVGTCFWERRLLDLGWCTFFWKRGRNEKGGKGLFLFKRTERKDFLFLFCEEHNHQPDGYIYF